MKHLQFYLGLFVLLTVSSVCAQEYRRFEGSNGKFIEAELLDYDDEKEIVHIKLKNKKEQRVKLSLFSEKSQRQILNNFEDVTDDPFGSETNKSNVNIRVYLSLDEYGEGLVRIEKTAKPYEDDFGGTPVIIPPLEKAKILKNKEGIIRIHQDFSNVDDIVLWATRPHGKESNKAVRIESNKLRMNPIDFTFPNNRKTKLAFLNHRAFFKLPLSICFDIASCDIGAIRLSVEKAPSKEGDYGRLTLNMAKKNSDNCHIGLHWIAGEKQDDLIKEADASLDSAFEKKFQIPGPSLKIEGRFAIFLSYGNVDHDIEPLEISNLTLTGRLIPLIGASFNEKDSIIFIRSVMPNRPAEKAGFKEGDIIKTINGKSPKTMYEAMALIGNSSFDEEITVVVERRGNEETIKVKPEL